MYMYTLPPHTQINGKLQWNNLCCTLIGSEGGGRREGGREGGGRREGGRREEGGGREGGTVLHLEVSGSTFEAIIIIIIL